MDSIADLIDSLQEQSDRLAVIQFDEDGSNAISRKDLHADISSLAGGLLESGVKEGDRVAICGQASRDWITVAMGALRAGGVVVPIDAQMEEANLAHILRDSDPACMFVDADQEERIGELELDNPPAIHILGQEGGAANWGRMFGNEPPNLPAVNSEQDAAIFYTSGTTGRPKGVPLTHANLVFQIQAIREAGIARPDDRPLLALPLHHVYPFVIGMLLPPAVGVPIVLPQSLTGPHLFKALREGRSTILFGIPRLYRALYDGIESRFTSRGRFAAWYFKLAVALAVFLRSRLHLSTGRWLLKPLHKQIGGTLRIMVSGGAKLDPRLGRRLEGMGWPVVIGYGLTETAPLLTIRYPGKGPLESVGKAVNGVELRLGENPATQTREAKPEDDQREILASGPGVFRGYRNREDDTARAFTPDGWFRTGDLGRFDEDGYLYIGGRVSTMIVTENGENIQPDELENAYSQHPLIEEIGILDKEGKLVGLVVADMDAMREAGYSDVRATVFQAIIERSQKLPSYMRISDIRVTSEPLPRTRLGKIRRHMLGERYDEAGREKRAGAGGRPLSDDEMAEEDRELLKKAPARAVWDELCKRFPDTDLRPDTNLQMELNVDSMEWLNLTLDVREQSGVEIGPEVIANVNTVRDLLSETAALATKKGKGAVDPAEKPYDILSEEDQRWLKPVGRGGHLLALSAYWIGSALLRIFYRIHVEGRENIPQDQPCVIAPNHASYLDTFVVGHLLGPGSLGWTYWAGAATAAFNTPLKRFGSRLGGGLPINPKEGADRAIAFAAAVLQRRQRLVWFPEGRRSWDGSLVEFKPGLGKVLEKVSVPVLPVAIEGTYAAWPIQRRFPRTGRISVVFGQPVDTETLRSEGEGKDSAHEIVDAIRDRISALQTTQ